MNEVKSLQSAELSLEKGLKDLALPVSVATPLLHYLELLQQWNKTYNLTAIDDLQDMVVQHILDSAVVLPYIDGKRLIDVGSGGGLPGLVLALLRPDLSVTLLDAVAKKTRFLNHVKRRLNLVNVSVIHSRVENYVPVEKFDVVISRAFAEINRFLNWTEHLGHGGTRFLAMKGPKEEPLAPSSHFKLKAEHRLNVPQLKAQRRLYEYQLKLDLSNHE